MHTKGWVSPGFEDVRDAFRDNFERGQEVGAAFSVWRGTECIVDLWGGNAALDALWEERSIAPIFSGSKALTAFCLWLLIDRGALDLDTPIHSIWPAFGKDSILVRNVLSHTDRLPGLYAKVEWADLLQPGRMATLLESQQPFDDPRASFTYHPMTYGWLCGEIVRRVDSRTLGQFFADEIAAPLGLDIWIGLPADQERRVVTLYGDEHWGLTGRNIILPTDDQRALDPVHAAIWYNPPLFGPSLERWNSRDVRAAEMPSVNGIGRALDIARLFSTFASGGDDLVRPATVDLCTRELASGIDVINDEYRRYAAGVSLHKSSNPFGPCDAAWGHLGAGGSIHGAWPPFGVGFSYVPNRLVAGNDQRGERLLEALHRALS